MSVHVDRHLLGEEEDDDNSSIGSFGSLEVDLPDERATSPQAAARSPSHRQTGSKPPPPATPNTASLPVTVVAAVRPQPTAAAAQPTSAPLAAPPAADKKAQKPAAAHDDDDSDVDGSVGSLDFSSESSFESDEEPPPVHDKSAVLVRSGASIVSDAAAASAQTPAKVPTPTAASIGGAVSTPAPPAAGGSDRRAADELDMDLDLGHSDLDFDFSSAGGSLPPSTFTSAVNSPAAATSAAALAAAAAAQVTRLTPTERGSKRGAYVPPTAVAATTPPANATPEPVVVAPVPTPAAAVPVAAAPVPEEPSEFVEYHPRESPSSTHQPSRSSHSLGSSDFASHSSYGDDDEYGGAQEYEAQEYRPTEYGLSSPYESTPSSYQPRAPAVNTYETTAAARARQAKKEEYVDRLARVNSTTSAAGGRRRKPERPAFNTIFSNKTPISRKLQAEAREMDLYNQTPRGPAAAAGVKKQPARRGPTTRHARREEAKEQQLVASSPGNDADFSDEEAAMARLDGGESAAKARAKKADARSSSAASGGGGARDEPVTSSSNALLAQRFGASSFDDADASEQPLEFDEDSPWLDSMITSFDKQAVGGPRGGAGHQPRASLIFTQNEPATEELDVERLSANMKQLFELQRTGSSGLPSAPPPAVQRANSAGSNAPAASVPAQTASAPVTTPTPTTTAPIATTPTTTAAPTHPIAAPLPVAATPIALAPPPAVPKPSTSPVIGLGLAAAIRAKQNAPPLPPKLRRPSKIETLPDADAIAAAAASLAATQLETVPEPAGEVDPLAAQLAEAGPPAVEVVEIDGDEKHDDAFASFSAHGSGSSIDATTAGAPRPLSPDEFYAQQLAAQEAQQAQLRAHSESLGSHAGVAPSGVSQLYLRELAASRTRQQRWNEVASSPAAWNGLAHPRDQYQRAIKPGPYSVEAKEEAARRKRARRQAALVRQLQTHHALTGVGVPPLEADPRPNASLLGLAYAGHEPHAALHHHAALLDGYPMTAAFLAGGGGIDAFAAYADATPDEIEATEGYGHDEYDDAPYDEYSNGPDEVAYPIGAHAHAQRMSRSRTAQEAAARAFGRMPHASHAHNKAHRSHLRAELMQTLHSGLFGDTSPERRALDGQPPPTHFQFKNAETGAREFVADGGDEPIGPHTATSLDDTINSSVGSAGETGTASISTTTADADQLVPYYPQSAGAHAYGSAHDPAVGSYDPSAFGGDAMGQVVPSHLLDAAASHFVGRELHRAEVGSRLPRTHASSRSQSKQRTDRLMHRLFHPEQARAEKQRLAAQAAAAFAAEQARKRKQKRPATANPPGRGQQQQQQQQQYQLQHHPSLDDTVLASNTTAAPLQNEYGALADVPPSDASVTLASLSEGGIDLAVDDHSLVEAADVPRSAATTGHAPTQSLADLADFSNDDYLSGGISAPPSPPSTNAHDTDAAIATMEQAVVENDTTANHPTATVNQTQLAPPPASTSSLSPRSQRGGVKTPRGASQQLVPVPSTLATRPSTADASLQPKPARKRKSKPPVAADPNAPPQPSHLDLLYYKHRLTEQKKVALRVARAAAELAPCTFQPNLETVAIRGRVQARVPSSAKPRAAREASEEATSSDHTSAVEGGPAPAARPRLEELYKSYVGKEERLAAQREEQARARLAAERSHAFAPQINPHRSVAATVALAHSAYVKGFDEKVVAMRRAADTPRSAGRIGSLESWGLRGGPSNVGPGGMSFSADHTPAAHHPILPPPTDRHYTSTAGQQVLLGPAPEPIPQIIVRGGSGTAPFQMISAHRSASNLSPAADQSHTTPAANVTTFVQDGDAIEETLLRHGLGGGARAPQQVGLGVVEHSDRLLGRSTHSTTPGSASAGAGAKNPSLGLGVVLPSNTPGSVVPRELTLYDRVSSYAYQYAKQQIVEGHLAAGISPTRRLPFSGASSHRATPAKHMPSAVDVSHGHGQRTPIASAAATTPATVPRSSAAPSTYSTPASYATPAARPKSPLATPNGTASAPDEDVLLFVDIQLGDRTERITVRRGDSPPALADAFTQEHALDDAYAPVIRAMLEQQMQAIENGGQQ